MFTKASNDIRKNAAVMGVLSVVSIIISLYIARDYQSGLQVLFWLVILTGMAAYFLRNMVNLDKLFYLFIFTIPLMNILEFSYKYILPLGGCFFIFLVILFFNKKIKINNILGTRNGRMLFYYVVLNFMLIPFSVDKKTSITYLISFPVIIVLWDWIIQYFNSEDRIINVLKVLNFVGALYSLIGMVILTLTYAGVDISLHLTYTKVRMYEVSSVFPNTNTLGMLLTFTIPCALYLFMESRNKAYYMICLLLMGVNLVLTFSRSSLGAVAIAVMIILLYKHKNLLYVGIAGFMSLFITVPFTTKFLDILKKISQSLLFLNSRAMLWDAAFKAIEEKPLTGFGVGNSVSAISQYSANIMGRTPHNTFLRMWVEMGLFGFLIYIVFIYNIIRDFFKTRDKSMLMITVFAIIIGSLFQQVFETMLLGGLSIIGGYFFIFTALFQSLVNYKNESWGEQNEDLLPC